MFGVSLKHKSERARMNSKTILRRVAGLLCGGGMARDSRPCQPSGSPPLRLEISIRENLKEELIEIDLGPHAAVPFRVFLTREGGYISTPTT